MIYVCLNKEQFIVVTSVIVASMLAVSSYICYKSRTQLKKIWCCFKKTHYELHGYLEYPGIIYNGNNQQITNFGTVDL